MGLCLLLLTEHLVSNELLSPEPGPGWRLPVVCLCPDLAPIIISVLGLEKVQKGASSYFSQEDGLFNNINMQWFYLIQNIL